jgi:predicted metal-dependent phosphoesterase TrpH
MKLDLHTHTRGSWDCLSDPEVLLERAEAKGIDRIAVTDHNALTVALELARVHPSRVIPGEEVRTLEGVDVIGLYLSREIPERTPALETCRLIREQGGIVYLPHPFASGKGGSGRLAEELAPHLDVVEVYNARLRSREKNERGARLAERHGLLRGAGSDAHSLGEVGNAWVEVPHHPNEPGPFLESLQSASVHGTRAGLHVFLLSNWAKLRKRMSVS